jgi:hypothetical protein
MNIWPFATTWSQVSFGSLETESAGTGSIERNVCRNAGFGSTIGVGGAGAGATA